MSDEILFTYTVPVEVKTITEYYFTQQKLECILPEGVKHLNPHAFSGSSFEKVVLPQSLLTIAQGSFAGSKIEQVTIPENTACGRYNCDSWVKEKDTDYAPFTRISGVCNVLKKIYVNEKNLFYSSKDGCLYSKDMKRLIKVPCCYDKNSIVLPEGVEEIGALAFTDCVSINEISLPGTVRIIGKLAFRGCQNLKSVSLPRNVQYAASHGTFDSDHDIQIILV